MGFLTEISTAWNEQWGAIIATILAGLALALLKSMSKKIQQLRSLVWRWKGWTIISKLYRWAKTLYRVRRAKSVMRRRLEEEEWVPIEIRTYDDCLRDDPSKSTRGQLKNITPAKPSWLNDYYVAAALESLSNERSVTKARLYSLRSWPPDPTTYCFKTINADRSACEEAFKIETNGKCLIYQSFEQSFDLCPRASRFECQHVAETVSPRVSLKDIAPPCELCWEKEPREHLAPPLRAAFSRTTAVTSTC